MEIELEILEQFQQLADDYGFNISIIKKWYNLLKEYPCVTEEKELQCLETFCQRRASSSVEIDGIKKYSESINDSIDYALYDTYENQAAPYLSEKARMRYGVKITNENYNFEEVYNFYLKHNV